jgi:hypothetical protein
MTATTTAPRIYVADLAAYNAGILHGTWIDLDASHANVGDLDTAIETMLAEGARRHGAETCSAVHEEFAIHDYEGFGPVPVGEYDSLDGVLAHVARMGEDPAPYFAFIDAVGVHEAAEFDQHIARGPYEEDVDWAWEYLEEQIGNDLSGWLQTKGLPEDLAACVKFDAADFVFSARCNYGLAVGRWGGKTYVFEGK